MKTRTLFAAATIFWMFAGAGMAVSQSYPSKPIRIVVGFPAGGGTDLTARIVGEKLSVAWGQPVVIENRAGAGGIIATEFVARSAPDGYTILMGGGNAMTVNPAVYTKLSYHPLDDFVPVTMVVQSPLIIAVHPSLPVKSVQDLIAYVKANHGLNFSSANMHTRLAGEMFNQMTGAKLTPIPYKGGGPAVTGVITGDVPMTIMDSGSVVAQMRAGMLRGLAVTTSARARAVPELPTVAEAGVPGYDIGTWFGFFVPAGTPKEIVNKLNAETARIIATPEIREKFGSALGGDPVGNSSEEFIAQIRNDIARFTVAARAAKMEPEN